MQTLDTEGDRRRQRQIFIRGEGESVFTARGETFAGVYRVSESAGGVWGAVREGQSASVKMENALFVK